MISENDPFQVNAGIPEKIFLKISLPGDDPLNVFSNKFNMNSIEIRAYTELIPKFVELEKNCRDGYSFLEEMMPKFYAGAANEATKGFFLILEDLSESFNMVRQSIIIF